MTSAASEGRRIRLSEWELANLHLPPVTTVTFYPGTAPAAYLDKRVAEILQKNPWLGGRLVKKSTPDGVRALSYSEDAEPARLAKRHFSVLAEGVEPADWRQALPRPDAPRPSARESRASQPVDYEKLRRLALTQLDLG